MLYPLSYEDKRWDVRYQLRHKPLRPEPPSRTGCLALPRRAGCRLPRSGSPGRRRNCRRPGLMSARRTDVRRAGALSSTVEFSKSDTAGNAGASTHGQQELNPHLPVLETGALPVELHPYNGNKKAAGPGSGAAA